MSGPDIKIKTLPRPNEKAAPALNFAPKRARGGAAKKRYTWILTGLSAAILAIAGLSYYQSSKASKRSPVKAKPRQTAVARHGASITKDMHDTKVAELMLKRRTQLENQRTIGARGGAEAYILSAPDDGRSLGVQMDQENSAEKVYEDLYGEKAVFADGLPEEKISNRLANRKWLNEMERAERINFVKNFIRQAYDRGYEVQLDQNLVVIGVKKITSPKSVNIDEVLNRLAKQGY